MLEPKIPKISCMLFDKSIKPIVMKITDNIDDQLLLTKAFTEIKYEQASRLFLDIVELFKVAELYSEEERYKILSILFLDRSHPHLSEVFEVQIKEGYLDETLLSELKQSKLFGNDADDRQYYDLCIQIQRFRHHIFFDKPDNLRDNHHLNFNKGPKIAAFSETKSETLLGTSYNHAIRYVSRFLVPDNIKGDYKAVLEKYFPFNKLKDNKIFRNKCHDLIKLNIKEIQTIIITLLYSYLRTNNIPEWLEYIDFDFTLPDHFKKLYESYTNSYLFEEFFSTPIEALNVLRADKQSCFANAKNYHTGDTILMEAIRRGDYARCEVIINFNTNVNAVNNRGYSAVHYAVEEKHTTLDHVNILNLLIKAKANLDTYDRGFYTPIYVACDTTLVTDSHLSLVSALLDNLLPNQVFRAENRYLSNPGHIAARRGNHAIFNILVQYAKKKQVGDFLESIKNIHGRSAAQELADYDSKNKPQAISPLATAVKAPVNPPKVSDTVNKSTLANSLGDTKKSDIFERLLNQIQQNIHQGIGATKAPSVEAYTTDNIFEISQTVKKNFLNSYSSKIKPFILELKRILDANDVAAIKYSNILSLCYKSSLSPILCINLIKLVDNQFANYLVSNSQPYEVAITQDDVHSFFVLVEKNNPDWQNNKNFHDSICQKILSHGSIKIAEKLKLITKFEFPKDFFTNVLIYKLNKEHPHEPFSILPDNFDLPVNAFLDKMKNKLNDLSHLLFCISNDTIKLSESHQSSLARPYSSFCYANSANDIPDSGQYILKTSFNVQNAPQNFLNSTGKDFGQFIITTKPSLSIPFPVYKLADLELSIYISDVSGMVEYKLTDGNKFIFWSEPLIYKNCLFSSVVNRLIFVLLNKISEFPNSKFFHLLNSSQDISNILNLLIGIMLDPSIREIKNISALKLHQNSTINTPLPEDIKDQLMAKIQSNDAIGLKEYLNNLQSYDLKNVYQCCLITAINQNKFQCVAVLLDYPIVIDKNNNEPLRLAFQNFDLNHNRPLNNSNDAISIINILLNQGKKLDVNFQISKIANINSASIFVETHSMYFLFYLLKVDYDYDLFTSILKKYTPNFKEVFQELIHQYIAVYHDDLLLKMLLNNSEQSELMLIKQSLVECLKSGSKFNTGSLAINHKDLIPVAIMSVVHDIIKIDDISSLKIFIQHRTQYLNSILSFNKFINNTPLSFLHYAIRANSKACLGYLIESGFHQDIDISTILLTALKSGNFEIINIFLKNGYTVNKLKIADLSDANEYIENIEFDFFVKLFYLFFINTETSSEAYRDSLIILGSLINAKLAKNTIKYIDFFEKLFLLDENEKLKALLIDLIPNLQLNEDDILKLINRKFIASPALLLAKLYDTNTTCYTKIFTALLELNQLKLDELVSLINQLLNNFSPRIDADSLKNIAINIFSCFDIGLIKNKKSHFENKYCQLMAFCFAFSNDSESFKKNALLTFQSSSYFSFQLLNIIFRYSIDDFLIFLFKNNYLDFNTNYCSSENARQKTEKISILHFLLQYKKMHNFDYFLKKFDLLINYGFNWQIKNSEKIPLYLTNDFFNFLTDFSTEEALQMLTVLPIGDVSHIDSLGNTFFHLLPISEISILMLEKYQKELPTKIRNNDDLTFIECIMQRACNDNSKLKDRIINFINTHSLNLRPYQLVTSEIKAVTPLFDNIFYPFAFTIDKASNPITYMLPVPNKGQNLTVHMLNEFSELIYAYRQYAVRKSVEFKPLKKAIPLVSFPGYQKNNGSDFGLKTKSEKFFAGWAPFKIFSDQNGSFFTSTENKKIYLEPLLAYLLQLTDNTAVEVFFKKNIEDVKNLYLAILHNDIERFKSCYTNLLTNKFPIPLVRVVSFAVDYTSTIMAYSPISLAMALYCRSESIKPLTDWLLSQQPLEYTFAQNNDYQYANTETSIPPWEILIENNQWSYFLKLWQHLTPIMSEGRINRFMAYINKILNTYPNLSDSINKFVTAKNLKSTVTSKKRKNNDTDQDEENFSPVKRKKVKKDSAVTSNVEVTLATSIAATSTATYPGTFFTTNGNQNLTSQNATQNQDQTNSQGPG